MTDEEEANTIYCGGPVNLKNSYLLPRCEFPENSRYEKDMWNCGLHPLITTFGYEKHTTTSWSKSKGGKVAIKAETVEKP